MFKNYFQIAFRNLIKHKTFALINIAGLALGMACVILISLWIEDELSFDTFHKNANRIYRITTTEKNNHFAGTPPLLAEAARSDCPAILKGVTTWGWDLGQKCLLEYGDKELEQRYGIVSPEFFDIFSYRFLSGNPQTALLDPYAVVITEELAHKFFGDEDPLGKILKQGRKDFKVSGIIENVPHNSLMQFDFLFSLNLFKKLGRNYNWEGIEFNTYLLLAKNSRIQQVTRQINASYLKSVPTGKFKFQLQPLKRIHLFSGHLQDDTFKHGSILHVLIFTTVALFILLIACMNYANLSTALFSHRSKEVGLRKIVGAKRSQLIKQFFGESILLTALSTFVALFIVECLLPIFNSFTGKKLDLIYSDWYIIVSFMAFIILVGLLAGSYPAIFLSSFKTTNILSASTGKYSRFSLFRKSLVVLQFAISIGLIIVALVVSEQIHFVKNKNPGFEKENLIYTRFHGFASEKSQVIKNDLLQFPDVLSGSLVSDLLVGGYSGINKLRVQGNMSEKKLRVNMLWVDDAFLETFKMEIEDGRFFSREFPADISTAIIMNETAVNALEIRNPTGKHLEFWAGGRQQKKHIVGVVKDFHVESFHEPIKPIMLIPGFEGNNYLILRIKPNQQNISGLITLMKNTVKKHLPDYPVEFHFFDDTLDALYKKELMLEKILNYAMIIAIFLSCLGLLGLTLFSIKNRTKEIGIRKVLGASIFRIVGGLTKDFVIWILAANLVAWPVAWYAMNRWLQNFAYRIDMSWPREITITEFLKLLVQNPIAGFYFFFSEVFISRGWWMFALAGGLALVIALLTVSWQAVRAATANPVDALRYE